MKTQLGLSSDVTFEWELFYQCVGQWLLLGKLNNKKEYFFIDEYQDYSQSELEYYKKYSQQAYLISSEILNSALVSKD